MHAYLREVDSLCASRDASPPRCVRARVQRRRPDVRSRDRPPGRTEVVHGSRDRNAARRARPPRARRRVGTLERHAVRRGDLASGRDLRDAGVGRLRGAGRPPGHDVLDAVPRGRVPISGAHESRRADGLRRESKQSERGHHHLRQRRDERGSQHRRSARGSHPDDRALPRRQAPLCPDGLLRRLRPQRDERGVDGLDPRRQHRYFAHRRRVPSFFALPVRRGPGRGESHDGGPANEPSRCDVCRQRGPDSERRGIAGRLDAVRDRHPAQQAARLGPDRGRRHATGVPDRHARESQCVRCRDHAGQHPGLRQHARRRQGLRAGPRHPSIRWHDRDGWQPALYRVQRHWNARGGPE